MDPDSNFIFERCKEVAKLSQEIVEKIKSKGIDKDQDMEYLVRTIDSYYMKYKIFRNLILHLPGNDIFCLRK